MTLKAKLLGGFVVMLLLTATMSSVGWYSMSHMGNQAQVVNRAESSLTSMLLAQVQQLEYLRTKDTSLTNGVLKHVEDAAGSLTEAIAIMERPENKAMAQRGLDFANWYKPAFSRLVENNNTVNRHDSEMVNSTPEMVRIVTQLTENVEKAVREGAIATALDSYRAIVNAHLAFANARLAARFFVAAPSAESARRAEVQLETARRSLKAAEGVLRLPENVALAQDLGRRLDSYTSTFASLRESTLRSEAMTREIGQKMVESMESMQKLTVMTMNTILSVQASGTTMLVVGAIFSLLLGLGLAFLLANNVQKQLGKDPSALALIAQRVIDGDYNIDDGSRRMGVYGNLVGMVDALKGHIDNARQESERARGESERARDAMRQAEAASNEAKHKADAMLVAADKLEAVATVVSSASSELSVQIAQSERGAAEQASRVTETATAMEEMNSTVLEVARNASQASEVSGVTRRKAEEGAKVVQQAVQSIQEVQVQSLKLKQDMEGLGENAQSISQIMGVISDIADQTNLLALNAAIEAARAGDAGRGFAVVADEVRKLAEKTMQSTTDVGNAIKAIQASAQKSMSQVDAAVQVIEKATDLANQSGTALGEIVDMVDSTADQVRAIAAASEQQSATSEEINSSIVQVNSIAGETARAMQEASRSVSDLTTQAQALTHLIENMKRG